MINIVIPMAGLGQRFFEAGYKNPKPFIPVFDKPMIENVIENLYIPGARYILIAREEHFVNNQKEIYSLETKYPIQWVKLKSLTEGTACTVLFARKLINNNVPLLIANSDQIVDLEISKFINDAQARNLDGSILCFEDFHKNPKWSFARIDQNGFVQEVKEKEPISTIATVGIYYFAKGQDFIEGTIEMIINRDRVNNEFFTCPVYNYLIKESKQIGIYKIDENQMHGIGTPEDLNLYLRKKH